MPTLSIDAKASLQFSVDRNVRALFRSTLELLEELAHEHDEALGKLEAALPAEYHPHLALADYYTEDKGERLRKAVLRKGNDALRAILEEIDRYEVTFPAPRGAGVATPSAQP